MKNRLLLCLLTVVLIASSAIAQNTNTPVVNASKGFNFQGYARDADGAALGSRSVQVQFTVYPDGDESSKDYQETHTLTTDPYGVFSVVVGSKSPTAFGKLNFGWKNYYLKVEVKSGASDWVTINNMELLSVPYAKSADNGVPVGTILPFGGPKSAIPAGYLACDGAAVSQTQYPYLYEVLGNAWGGSGSNFNVPDLRGYFLRGVSDGQGTDPDRATRYAKNTGGNDKDNVGSYQDEQTKSHTHTASGTTNTDGSHQHKGHVTARADNDDNDTPHNFLTYDGANYYYNTIDIKANGSEHAHNFSLTTNATGGNETRPKNAYVLFIIKY
ncbi:Microcystin-dependent protein [Catalinimonas alkaloidigena]|uniref:Microcystin-dependent protein n=1 Tax=Catalinimonas alkaloidigena TaxID=1075417 RepID=A0A1G8XFZ8_9BACT|nr:tail fiber protein [Catalinimonas alkaloidigena]SDJ89492.1 Microcystin-dependent protein [Catalinimonas alkaloidigena]